MGRRSGYIEDRDLRQLSKVELEFELSVWKERARASANSWRRKAAESRVHAIEKAIAAA
jgi:hypothetical protein